MAKIRVHEIAKELGKPSKEMVDILQKMGLDVKNHMSTMEDSQASWVRKQLTEQDRGSIRPQREPAPPKTKGDTSAQQASAGDVERKPADRPSQSERAPQTWRPSQGGATGEGGSQTQPRPRTEDRPTAQQGQTQGGRPPQQGGPRPQGQEQGQRPPQHGPRPQPQGQAQGGRPPQQSGGRPQQIGRAHV